MKNPHNFILNFIASSCLLFAATSAQAVEPLALQQIMKDLGKNMQVITDGIPAKLDLVKKNRTPDCRSSPATLLRENAHHGLHGHQHEQVQGP